MDVVSLGVFCGALLLNAGTPGPGVAALVAWTVTSGWRDVTPFVAAMWIGEALWLCAALAGLSRLAEDFHHGFVVLKWAGIAYLLRLAARMWRERRVGAGDCPAIPFRPASMFAAGLGLTLANPKIMVFYVALLPSLIDVTSLDLAAWVTLPLATLACLSVVDLGWIVLATRSRRFLASSRAMRLANRLGAGAMGCAAAAIAWRH
ncbi:MAG: LysE family translocator [Rhodospirillales bacterium]|jgi:threonine/homoserine/homoserine lactone efflux protein|nr:LysE family translocator [Rhodospirillales bacterium]